MTVARRASLVPVLALAVLTCAGCLSTSDEESRQASLYASAPDPNAIGPPSDAAPILPWTTEFMLPAVLVAKEVRIEGPPGLLEHVATRIDPLVHTQDVRTIPKGLRQIFELRAPESDAQAAAWSQEAPPEIRAWLDGLELVVTRRLIVLERPAGDEVRVVASGEVFWRPVDGPGERRGERIEFTGIVEEPRPAENDVPDPRP